MRPHTMVILQRNSQLSPISSSTELGCPRRATWRAEPARQGPTWNVRAAGSIHGYPTTATRGHAPDDDHLDEPGRPGAPTMLRDRGALEDTATRLPGVAAGPGALAIPRPHDRRDGSCGSGGTNACAAQRGVLRVVPRHGVLPKPLHRGLTHGAHEGGCGEGSWSGQPSPLPDADLTALCC